MESAYNIIAIKVQFALDWALFFKTILNTSGVKAFQSVAPYSHISAALTALLGKGAFHRMAEIRLLALERGSKQYHQPQLPDLTKKFISNIHLHLSLSDINILHILSLIHI